MGPHPDDGRLNRWEDISNDERSAMHASLAEALPAGRVGEVALHVWERAHYAKHVEEVNHGDHS